MVGFGGKVKIEECRITIFEKKTKDNDDLKIFKFYFLTIILDFE